MTFEEASQKTRSEKITLVIMRAVEQVKLFTLSSGSVYYRDVPFWIDSVKDSLNPLVLASSISLNQGEYYFDKTIKRLYIRTSDSSDPKTRNISLTYKLFFSNSPVILPNDLSGGDPVSWEPIVNSIGAISQQLDEESTGIVLESTSSVDFINSEGYWDEIFDTLIWENQPSEFYSYISGTNVSESQKVFEGLIESKDFSSDKVSFRFKDSFFRLRDFVSLGRFSSLDGKIDPAINDKPKRRIYGQAKQLECVGVDKILDGYELTGTISGAIDTQIITGTGTLFLSELAPDDEISFLQNNEVLKFTIQSIESNTSLTVGSELDLNIVNQPSISVKPSIQPRTKNRKWHIAGHKLRSPECEIFSVISDNRFQVDNVIDFFPGDQVEINGDLVSIRRISGDTIILENAVSPTPLAGDVIYKLPVQKVFVGSREYIYSRDWTIANGTNALIEFNDLAEFNSIGEKSLGVSLTFTSGSRTLTTSSVVDFRSILKPYDWIRSSSITEPDFYEILQVSEQSITLRTPFVGLSATKTARIKVIDHISDDSLVTCNCLGIEVSGSWVKTPSDAVRHLILNDAQFPAVNEQSFLKAKSDCSYILSLPIPEQIGSEPPSIRDTITKINESVFGSLYGNSSFEISYGILNSQKPENTQILKDDDIISFDAKSTTNISNKVKVNYRPFKDIFSGEDSFESITKGSDFVDSLIGIKKTKEVTLYIFEEDKANIMAQRILLFNSMSSTVVTVKAKLNLATKAVNDKMFLSLDRLYKRYGGRDKRKIGTIIGIKKNGFDTDVSFVDLGNVYNRVPSIAPNTTLDYSAQIEDDLIRYGYILDNQVLTPDPSSEVSLGNNIIG